MALAGLGSATFVFRWVGQSTAALDQLWASRRIGVAVARDAILDARREVAERHVHNVRDVENSRRAVAIHIRSFRSASGVDDFTGPAESNTDSLNDIQDITDHRVAIGVAGTWA